ncbi:DUF1538 domain-containing protein [Thermodesulfobacteriota bacterium]
MELLSIFLNTLVSTVRDVLPVLVLLLVFQLFVLKQPIPHWRRLLTGSIFALLGLALFLIGLELALFPLGDSMAKQLTAPEFVFGSGTVPTDAGWWDYWWVYVFAALVGFSTTVAEPALIAVAYKAHEVSRGSISQWGLRLAVAIGVAVGIALGTFRIVTGTPLYAYILAAYVIVIVQTLFAPKLIIPLAYDSGGVTTSTVTVPLVAALGLGLSSSIPGRNPALDGFGLVAFASVFPIMTVMGYAQIVQWKTARRRDAVEEK